MVIMIHPGRSR